MTKSNASLEELDKRLKDAIQTLYIMQSNVHGYTGPETQQSLVTQVRNLEPQLVALDTDALPRDLSEVTREILEYVDDGRNPDIYNRQFVETVMRNNAYTKGKSEAFAEFRDVLAEEIVKGLGSEIEPMVDRATGKAPAVSHSAGARMAQVTEKDKEMTNGA